jgi:hypothetical protein
VVAVRHHPVVGADLHGERHRVGVAVDHDDRGAGDGLEHLDADVAEASGADDDADVAGPGGPGRLGRRVVGGEARVRQGGDIRGLEAVVDLDDTAGRGPKQLRVATVGVDARELAVLAVHVVPETAGPAEPARHERVQDDLVPDRDVRDRVADGVHPTGVLVTDRVGQGDPRLRLPLPLEDVEVGAADPGATDPDDDVEGAFDDRFRDFRQLQLGVVADDLDGSHDVLLVSVMWVWMPSASPSA